MLVCNVDQIVKRILMTVWMLIATTVPVWIVCQAITVLVMQTTLVVTVKIWTTVLFTVLSDPMVVIEMVFVVSMVVLV